MSMSKERGKSGVGEGVEGGTWSRVLWDHGPRKQWEPVLFGSALSSIVTSFRDDGLEVDSCPRTPGSFTGFRSV